jgi:hypothetical protein
VIDIRAIARSRGRPQMVVSYSIVGAIARMGLRSIRLEAIKMPRLRPQLITGQIIIGAISSRIITGRLRTQITMDIAGRLKKIGMLAMEVRLAMMMDAGGLSSQIRRNIAGIRLRLDAIKTFAGRIRMDAMRSKSAEVLLFLNSGLTTPWARGHRG